ncbi:MAG: hypothetical protein WCJ35_21905 [Planctomycetota bacterium]
MQDFVTVATLFSLAEAEPERLALEAAGISTLATDENIGSMLVPNVFGGIKLQVAAKDAARATEVLATFEAESQSDAPKKSFFLDDGASLNCPKCRAAIWFPSERRGHVEVCPECEAYVDVPE